MHPRAHTHADTRGPRSLRAGLHFLKDPASAEFQRAYVEAVVLRLLWGLCGFGTQRVTLQQWRRSSVSEVLYQLDDEADINLAREYFSYNHFYVIWCLFWELDEDEDARLTKQDLLRYGSYGLSSCVVDRIWALRRDTSKDGMGCAALARATQPAALRCRRGRAAGAGTPILSTSCSRRRTSSPPRRSRTGCTCSTATATA